MAAYPKREYVREEDGSSTRSAGGYITGHRPRNGESLLRLRRATTARGDRPAMLGIQPTFDLRRLQGRMEDSCRGPKEGRDCFPAPTTAEETVKKFNHQPSNATVASGAADPDQDGHQGVFLLTPALPFLPKKEKDADVLHHPPTSELPMIKIPAALQSERTKRNWIKERIGYKPSRLWDDPKGPEYEVWYVKAGRHRPY